MITKEECLEAYEKLKYDHYLITEDDDGNLIHINNLYKNELNLFKHLINEHFDNPPLKFEDLKVGMWVWDNEIKTYYQIKAKYIISVGGYKVLEIITSNFINEKWIYRTSHIYFEENRFYRKQVEE